MTAPAFKIGDREIGAGRPCFVVAELSANHNQSLDRAIAIVRAAKAAGADAIKLQTYTADTLTIDSDAEWFRVPSSTPWGGRTLHALYGEAFTPWEWHAKLFEVAATEGLVCFSTPFDASAIALLEELGNPVYKVASFELIDTELLALMGSTGKPVIASTGMATFGEIEEAVSTLRRAGARDIALLKCTSAYPAPAKGMHLRTIPHLAATFGVVAGLSDHTAGGAVAVAAVALGASIIEKHFTMDRRDGGPDSSFSMEPSEFRLMVDDLRRAEDALGQVSFERTESERASLVFRRSLFVVRDVRRGEAFTRDNVRSIRPGYGLAPKHLPEILDRAAARDLARGTPLSWELVGPLLG